MPRNAVTSDKIPKPIAPFSIAVRDGDRVYCSGQVGTDPGSGKLVDGGVVAQTQQAFRNIEAILKAAGKSLDDVVKVNVYLADMKNFAAMNEVYGRLFRAPYPARTTIGVAALPLGAAVEIEMIAG
jgi:2-iminobutanoate/2-iminopropanoate deaminase